MTVKLLTEHHLDLLSLKGGCRGSPESSLVKMPHCWKSRVAAHIIKTPHPVMCAAETVTATADILKQTRGLVSK